MRRINALDSDKDYLWPATFISLLVHGLVFWLFLPAASDWFAPREIPPTTVINYRTLNEPELAERLAQWSAVGGGTQQEAVTAASPFQSAGTLSINDLFLQAMLRKQQALERTQQELLEQLESQYKSAPERHEAEHELTAEPTEHGLEVINITERRLAELRLEIEQFQQRPRYHFIGPSALASPFAAYMQAWQAKVERIGTEHYPAQARGRASATLQITVYIDQNGEIIKMEFDQPAEDPLFNLAAQRIIQLAAPFAPFSPEMSEHTDVLAITRTWHFEQGQLTTSNVQNHE